MSSVCCISVVQTWRDNIVTSEIGVGAYHTSYLGQWMSDIRLTYDVRTWMWRWLLLWLGHWQMWDVSQYMYSQTHLVRVPSTDRVPSWVPPHSFIPGLKPSFSANPFHHNLSFLLQDWLWIPGLFTNTCGHIRFYFFSLFSFLVNPCDID